MKVGPTDGGADVDMGPVITPRASRQSRAAISTSASSEGATRGPRRPQGARAATAFCSARASSIACSPRCAWPARKSSARCCRCVRAADLDEALAVGRNCQYGNGASIFTRSG